MEPQSSTPNLDKIRTRIKNLIAKAERTDFPEESATLYAAAEELMLKYNLQVENQSYNTSETYIVRLRFKFSGPALYWRPWCFGVGYIVAAVDRVALAVNERNREFILYGTEDDVDYMESLLRSAWRAAFQNMKRETRESTEYLRATSNSDKSTFRKSYIEGFGEGVAVKIRKTHATIPGADLVLARRKDDIEQAMLADGVMVSSKATRREVNSYAYWAGHDAGHKMSA